MPRYFHPTPFVICPPDNLTTSRPDLRRMAATLSRKYADRMVVSEDDLQRMGRALWDALGVADEFERARQQAGAGVLAMLIESSAAEVQALPWETLCHPTLGFLGREPAFSLSRRMAPPERGSAPLEKGPLRVLLFTSLPDDLNPETQRLNVEEEQAQVQEALLPWIAKGRVELTIPDDGRFATLKDLLASFEPHVLFLSGHGNFHFQPHSSEAPYGEFFFESETGAAQAVNEAQIAAALTGTRVQLVVLSACESSKAASDALAHGLAQRISAQGIAHVIGMRESVLDPAGIVFAHALCGELAHGERVDGALQAARLAMRTPLAGPARGDAGPAALTELSLGQWCLPMLIAPDPARGVIDWDFAPRAGDEPINKASLHGISLPARFIGRRAELRRCQGALLKGELRKLLISGPGGQGKTALAGKLALDLQRQGYRVLAWSARPENPWRDFEFDMELALDENHAQRFSQFRPRLEDDARRARFMFDLLMEQYQHRVVFWLDNLETLQDADTLQLNEATVAAWLREALAYQDLIVLATTRWQLPGWPGEVLPLVHASYGDFLQMAQQLAQRKQLQAALLEEPGRMRQVYAALGGNCRGLEWFSAATLGMASGEDSAFLERLEKTQSDLRENMALEAIFTHLPGDAQTLLRRLPVYPDAVPLEGIVKLGLDLPEPQACLSRLLAVSLVEARYEPNWEVTQYQCAPAVVDWLRAGQVIDAKPAWANLAADYMLYLFNNERGTLSQAIATHHALKRAGRQAEADRLALDYIVARLDRAGFYSALLSEWLPEICESPDLQTRGEASGWTGKLFLNTSDYAMALAYLKQSLAICQEIGDKAGEGAALGNISKIYRVQGDYQTGLAYLKQCLAIFRQIGNKAGEGTALNDISQIYKAQGDYETALAYLKKSLAIYQQIGVKAGEGATLNNISQIYIVRGDHKEALAYLKQSLAIYQQIGDIAGEGVALNRVAQIYHTQGDYVTALAYLKQSLAIQQQIGDKAGEGTTLNNISQIYQAQGDYETALAYLKQSLAIQQQIGDKAGEGTTLNNISQIYDAQGDYETALAYLTQSLVIQQKIGDKKHEGTTLNNISQIYDRKGDYETALAYLKQSLAIHQQIGDKEGEGTALGNISKIYYAQGDYETALAHMRQSLAIQQQIGDKAGEGTMLNNISSIYRAKGDYETALAYLKQSLAIQQQIGDKAGLCATLFNMGYIYLQNKQVQEAVSAWVTSYLIAKSINLAQVLQALAKLAPRLGLPEGLAGWEELAQRFQGGQEKNTSPSNQG